MKIPTSVILLLAIGLRFSVASSGRIDSLKRILLLHQSDTVRLVGALNELSAEYRNNNPDTALKLAQQAMGLARGAHDKKGLADALLAGGMALKNTGDYNHALERILEARSQYLSLLQKSNGDFAAIKNSLSNTYNETGLIFGYQGRYEEALLSHRKCMELRKESRDEKGLAGCYNNIGLIQMDQGNYLEAIQNYFAALEINRKTGNRSWEAINYKNIGSVYSRLDNDSEALKYHLASLNIRNSLGDKKGIASSLTSIGTVYLDQRNYTSALNYLERALSLMQEIHDTRGVSGVHNKIGDVYRHLDKPEEALRHYYISLKINQDIGDKKNTGFSALDIGEVLLAQKKFSLSSEYLNRGLELGKSIGSKELIKTGHHLIARLDSTRGDYKSFLHHYQQYRIYADSLNGEELTRKMAVSELNHAFLKREDSLKTIQQKSETVSRANLKNQVILRNAMAGLALVIVLSSLISFRFYKRSRDAQTRHKESEYTSSMAEYEMKALRAQINPHFIFNCLNAVQRYILKNDRNNAVDYLQKFALLMRMILNHSEKEKVTLEDELTMLEYYMQLESLRNDHGFDYEIVIDDAIDREAEKVPTMILQPFIENAIWHGLQHRESRGKIKIILQKDKDRLKCIIEDNGVGREMATAIRQRQPGSSGSKGMDITTARMELLNQKQNIPNSFIITDLHDSENNPSGTRVELFFEGA